MIGGQGGLAGHLALGQFVLQQACRDARAQGEQVKQQAIQELNAARVQFQQDVKAAFSAFSRS